MLPLTGVQVIDLTDGRGEGCGRYLADLGADVVLVEPPGGVSSRHRLPRHGDTSLSFAANAANKRSVTLDFADGDDRERFTDLLAAADIWIDGTDPDVLAHHGLAPDDICQRLPHLVVVSITEFGQWGPYRDWVATDAVHMALTPSLSQSGVPGRAPLLPPGRFSEVAVGIQAAWVALLAYWRRLEGGEGDHLDLSVFEATGQVIDPTIGSIGTAAAAQRPRTAARGRPPAHAYPIFRCDDGYVRLVMLSPRQWRGMFSWLGEPDAFADPKYDRISERFAASVQLHPLIATLVGDRTMLDLVAEGQTRGVPIAPVLTPNQVLDVEHFKARQAFVDLDVSGQAGRLPRGYVLIDGEPAGARTPPPAIGNDNGSIDWQDRRQPSPHVAGPRPLSALRVLDLGVIVMGAEAGRLFADQGADVIKVENRQFPDGARAAGMNKNFASGQRNKRSIGINLRHPDGVAVFERLVAVSDVVLSNFKPGTMESLGLGAKHLASINPRIVVATSSAMGESGPWRDWMGYGPLVRAVSGLSSLWRDPGVEGGFGDATTIYPDHLVGRVVDTAVLAALIARRTSGHGAHIESSQAEAILASLSPTMLRESLEPGAAVPGAEADADAPGGIYPCAGDDEWCAITVRGDRDWARLVDALGHPAWSADPALTTTAGRRAARAVLDAGLSAWTARRGRHQAAELLQAAGVPAAPMQRPLDYLQDPHLRARGFFRTFEQPGLDRMVTTENGPCLATGLPQPPMLPAPLQGQHTREVCREVLGMTDAEVDELVGTNALEEHPPAPAQPSA